MKGAIVKVENLSHRYSVQWAIRDINFEIDRTGIYGLLGSNGAGKSTTMNIMCGVLRQTRGDVYIKGISMSEKPVEAKRHIGFLPQTPPLHPDLTVREHATKETASASAWENYTINYTPAIISTLPTPYRKTGLWGKQMCKCLSGILFSPTTKPKTHESA